MTPGRPRGSSATPGVVVETPPDVVPGTVVLPPGGPSISTPRYLVFYGSLRAGLHLGGEPPFAPFVRHVGPCRLGGRLHEVDGGAYPSLTLSDLGEADVVHGDLYELLDEAALDLLDRWEEYDPARPDRSPYVRRVVTLLEPVVEAWVYVGQHRHRGAVVEGGDWRRHGRRPRS